MKAVILAGGLGTRISEESHLRPKPMIEIGGRPIIWHIMKIYSHYGINEFLILCGYKGYLIKEYFSNFVLHNSDVTVDILNNTVNFSHSSLEPWKVTIVDTGLETQTGGRLKAVSGHLSDTFCLTYGDGLSDVNISALLDFHRSHGKEATITAVRPPGRFGALTLESSTVTNFHEKPDGDGGYINGGFFVLEPSVLNRIHSSFDIWEQRPLNSLANDGQLRAYKHTGFFQPMDTLRDMNYLAELWSSESPPWKVW